MIGIAAALGELAAFPADRARIVEPNILRSKFLPDKP
jgi:hypothetical protein